MSTNRGGKREGAGRKTSDSSKRMVSFRLAPDVLEYLRSVTNKPQAQVIEEAVRAHKGRKMKSFSSAGVNYELASQAQQGCLYMSTDKHGNVDYTFLMGHGHTPPQIITAFQEKDRDRYLDREYQD